MERQVILQSRGSTGPTLDAVLRPSDSSLLALSVNIDNHGSHWLNTSLVFVILEKGKTEYLGGLP